MGWWKSEHGVIGDHPADLVDNMFKMVETAYLVEAGRLPTQGELADLLEFCSNGVFKVKCGSPRYAFTKAYMEDNVPRAAKKGAQGCLGKAAQPPPGFQVNVDPVTGEHLAAPDASSEHGDGYGEQCD